MNHMKTSSTIVYRNNNPQSEPQTRTVTKKVVVQLTRFEKYLYITLVTAIAVIAIYMLSLKMDAYDTNGKIADLDSKLNNNQAKIAQFNLKLRKFFLPTHLRQG